MSLDAIVSCITIIRQKSHLLYRFAAWINWIIVRTTIILPFVYLLQCNTFIFEILRLKCLSRAVRGGGPGGPVPFRIYVDSGVVFLCVAALAPASPIVAPVALLYFLVFCPILRWLLIFVYRPYSDAGGQRWPFVFQIFISAMIFAQVSRQTPSYHSDVHSSEFLL